MASQQEVKLQYARSVAQHGRRLPDDFDVLRLKRTTSRKNRQNTINNEAEDADLRIFLGAVVTIDMLDPNAQFGRSLARAIGKVVRNIPPEPYPAPGVATPIIPLMRIRQAEAGDYHLAGFTLQLLQVTFGSGDSPEREVET